MTGHEQFRRLTYVIWAAATALGQASKIDVVLTRDLTVASMLARVPRPLRPALVYESHGLAPVFARTRPEMISGGAAAPAGKLRRLAGRESRVWRGAEG